MGATHAPTTAGWNRRALLAGAAASTFAGSAARAGGLRPSVEEWRAIARDAYVYGFPLIDNYRVLHSYFVDRAHSEYKGPWNQVHSMGRVFTPRDRAIQSPNSDTPYSMLGADLRAEPLVLTLPAVADGRYLSAQFVDLYTHNFAYAGTRTTGQGGGRFLLAGPDWRGETPKGVDAVYRCETDLAFVFYRTQLYRADDIENVRRIQAGYTAQTLSAYLGRPAPPPAPPIDFPTPLSRADERGSLDAFRQLNFILRFCPGHPSERDMMRRFSRIGVGPGRAFEPQALPANLREATTAGIDDAWRAYDEVVGRMASREVTAADLFGTRAYLGGNYLYRMVGAERGIYGQSREEAWYSGYQTDAAGERPDGALHGYSLRFGPGQVPPVDAFWSLTMYEMPTSLLYANPLDRYLINSPMQPDLRLDADGGLTLYLQHASPGPALETNWLPAPKGPFMAALRLYLPKPDAIDGRWLRPELQRTS